MDEQVGIVDCRASRRRHWRHHHRLFLCARRNLAPEGCHFDDLRPELDVRQAETPADDPAVPEEALDLVWMRGGADVEVLRRSAEQQIPYAAPNEVGDVIELTQTVQDLEGVRVDVLP